MLKAACSHPLCFQNTCMRPLRPWPVWPDVSPTLGPSSEPPAEASAEGCQTTARRVTREGSLWGCVWPAWPHHIPETRGVTGEEGHISESENAGHSLVRPRGTMG